MIKDIAFELVSSIVIGLIVGYILAKHFNNNIFIPIFFILGVISGFYRIYKFVKNIEQ
ncbi:AtpZ/AtpI family protein [Methanocaldococcus indicus]|uniref:AtpZ/AtpI family protein n=1 Tax=Methanocaldococcus indicus TaxID=213231 RepID=UPI003C6D7454